MVALNQRYVYLIPLLVVSMKHDRGEAVVQNCSSNQDCKLQSCCMLSSKPRIDVCISEEDCGVKECCSSKTCTYSNQDSRCDCRRSSICTKMGLHCCKQKLYDERSKCKTNCIDEPCHDDSDCATGECCSRKNKCTKNKYICLEVCNTNSGCLNSVYQPYCCGHRYARRFCSHTCVGWSCYSDSDCGGPEECCVNSLCSKSKSQCVDDSFIKVLIIVASLLTTVIISAVVIALFCYYRKQGRCKLFQQRDETHEQEIELQSNPNSNHETHEDEQPNHPPPPYSILDEPYPSIQNDEFPPYYKSQDLQT